MIKNNNVDSQYIEGQDNVRVLSSPFLMHSQINNLLIREFEVSDCASLMRMHQDKKVRSLLIDDQPLDNFDFCVAFIRRLQEVYRDFPGLGIWCASCLDENDVDKKIENKFAGWFNLMPIPEQLDELELGSRLLPEYWGTGVALSGGEALLEHAFTVLDYPRVWIACHPDHRSVDYIAHALGFERAGIRLYLNAPAQYYCLQKERWLSWKILNRRQKIKHGIKSYKNKLIKQDGLDQIEFDVLGNDDELKVALK